MSATAAARSSTPQIGIEAGRLLIDGRRFTVLGAELHNSSSSTEAAIARSFARAAAIGANTVLAPVAWDLFEPTEGTFDYTLIDAMLAHARENELRLVVLWFGTWKNGMSNYAPAWVKLDTARFPRAEIGQGRRIEHITPFSEAARHADARAFAALMSHLHDVDHRRTTIMVQVENECGLLGDARDRGPDADIAWDGIVPDRVMEAVSSSPTMPAHREWQQNGSRRTGSWAHVFGVSLISEELFMAAAYADFIEHVAAAGRSQHDIPLYVNAWLDTAPSTDGLASNMAGGETPGSYPSGGPVISVAPVWRQVAPSIEFLSPDIYFGDFRKTCEDFAAASDDALFIPEMRRSQEGVAQMMLAVAELGAIGVAPFGVDSLDPTDPAWARLADGYAHLRAAAESFARYPDAHGRAFLLDSENPSIEFDFSGYRLLIDSAPGGTPPHANASVYGFVIEEQPGQVLIAGRGFMLVFDRSDTRPSGILSADEISGNDGRTVTRRFNGDEIFSGKFAIFPGIGPQPDSPDQPISISADMTGIVRYSFYRY